MSRYRILILKEEPDIEGTIKALIQGITDLQKMNQSGELDNRAKTEAQANFKKRQFSNFIKLVLRAGKDINNLINEQIQKVRITATIKRMDENTLILSTICIGLSEIEALRELVKNTKYLPKGIRNFLVDGLDTTTLVDNWIIKGASPCGKIMIERLKDNGSVEKIIYGRD